ncbi:MAG: carboxypeptidase regulatory-like domain-containing protein [Thermoplasmata archaeon]
MPRDHRSKGWMAGVAFVLLLAVALAPFMHCEPQGDELTATVSAADYTGTIEVNVTDNVGRNVTDALVTLENNDTYISWPADENGRLTITGLLADSNGTEYNLSAQCDGYEKLAVVSVIVTPSNTTWVNLTVRGGLIYGTVTEDWEPVVGINISLDDFGLNTTSGSDGSYTIDGLKGGAYSLTATAVNHDPLTRVVTLPIGGFARLDFALASQMGSISGIVLHATSLEPIEDANVSVKVEGPPPVTITVTTEVDGSYYVPNLPEGTYSVAVSLEGFNTSTLEGVEVVSGAATTDVDVFLEEKATKLLGTVRSGTVLLVGANVSVWGTEYYGLSSIDGKYEIEGIPTGTYTVEASLQGYLNVTVPGVEIARGSELQLDFNLTGLPGALFGIVVDAVTGDQLAGVTVVVLPQRETITNTNGEFQFTGLPADEYIVRFTLDGYQPKEIGPIATTLDETTEMGSIELEPTRESFGGFIFGFDLAHSMMILALFLTIIILAFAVVLRIRTFESPDKTPAIYDELDEEDAEEAQEEDELSEVDAQESSLVDEPSVGNGHSGE